MEEQLVSWEAAKLLKKKGFNIPTDYVYNTEGDIGKGGNTYNWNGFGDSSWTSASAPSQSLAQKWLREKHNLFAQSFCNASGWAWQIDKCNGTFVKWSEYTGPNAGGQWDTYEEALECGIIELLKFLNNRYHE